jgi:CDP-glucose 4,6-dehydratase
MPLAVRNPNATRPWQHVLDCISGYLTLGAKLLDGEAKAATAYNFGPSEIDNLSVAQLLEKLVLSWPELSWKAEPLSNSAPHEAGFLYLDSSRARRQLGWRPTWSLDVALEKTATWYRTVEADPAQARGITRMQVMEYLSQLPSV